MTVLIRGEFENSFLNNVPTKIEIVEFVKIRYFC